MCSPSELPCALSPARNFSKLTKHKHLPFLQVGGVSIQGGTVNFQSCELHHNTGHDMHQTMVSCPFLEPASDPQRKNFPSTDQKQVLALSVAGWRDGRGRRQCDSGELKHLFQHRMGRERLPSEPSLYFLSTPPAEETSLN